MVVADLRQVVTVELKMADGTVVEVYDSIQSYLARYNTTRPAEIEEAVMKFAISAHAYLHRDDTEQ